MNLATKPPASRIAAVTASWYPCSTSRRSSASSACDRAVEPTRSANRTVSCRRSADGSGAGAADAAGASAADAAGAGAAAGALGAGVSAAGPDRAAIAFSRRGRSPSDTPSSFSSSGPRAGNTSKSMSFDRKASAYFSSPISLSHAVMPVMRISLSPVPIVVNPPTRGRTSKAIAACGRTTAAPSPTVEPHRRRAGC